MGLWCGLPVSCASLVKTDGTHTLYIILSLSTGQVYMQAGVNSGRY